MLRTRPLTPLTEMDQPGGPVPLSVFRGTALYVGYIGNFANIDRALCTREGNGDCNPLDPILPPTYSSLMNDGKTIYVKVSYLLRF